MKNLKSKQNSRNHQSKFLKKGILIFALLSFINVSAQNIIDIIYVAADGVTNDIKKAKSFIIVKEYPNYYERIDYAKAGPLFKSSSYKDTGLTILHGNYYEYRPDGTILYAGNYKDNKKSEYWLTYNNAGVVIQSEKYEDGTLVEKVAPNKKDSSKVYGDEREPEFPGGNSAWDRYIAINLKKNKTAKSLANGGTVTVNFMIGVDGLVREAFITKSVEYTLDENALEIIKQSPKWKAAWQNGHAVSSYRRQSFTYPANKK